MRSWWAVGFGAFRAACGHNSGSSPDAAPDAPLMPTYANQATLALPMPIAHAILGSEIGVSADGRTIAVSCIGPSGNGGDTGGVYIFVLGPDGWTQQAYLQPSVIHVGDTFGIDVKLSGSGDTLVIGAALESSAATGVDGDANDHSASWAGAAYVFRRNGVNWGQQAYLKASNTGAQDLFGSPVVISSDGNTIAIGAVGESSGVAGNELDNSATQAGAAYVFTTNGTTWMQQAYLKASNLEAKDAFGGSLAISADGATLVVGASDESSAATGVDGDQTDNSALHAGAAYVFRRSSGAWAQSAYLKSSRSIVGGGFGSRLALSGLGTTLIASAPSEARMDSAGSPITNAGAAYVFAFDGTSWAQTAVLEAAAPATSDSFAVPAISADGKILAAGIRGAAMSSGEVISYAETAGAWQPFAQPTPPMLVSGDQLGIAVGLSHDGSVLAVSAPFADVGATDTGAVYVFY